MAGEVASFLQPTASERLDPLLWPVLAILLYTTFCQVSVSETLTAFRNGRYLAASLLTNFALVPVIVWILGWLLPADPAIRLGVFMVLLVPCTDWFVTFTYLGKGATRLAVAVVPIQLIVQFALLPLYLWVFMGQDFVQAVTVGPFLQVFIGIILTPFILAILTRYWAGHHSTGSGWLRATTWLPVPLLALVLFLITASQGKAMAQAFASLGWVAMVFALYLIAAAPVARLIAFVFRMEPDAGRTLAFNVGTRNSFVVLPLALALPAGWEAAIVAIVLQTFIELFGMIVYVWLVPKYIFPPKDTSKRCSAGMKAFF